MTVTINKITLKNLKEVKGLLASSRLFDKTSQGDTIEFMTLILKYQKFHGKDPFSKENIKRVLQFKQELIKRGEYY